MLGVSDVAASAAIVDVGAAELSTTAGELFGWSVEPSAATSLSALKAPSE